MKNLLTRTTVKFAEKRNLEVALNDLSQDWEKEGYFIMALTSEAAMDESPEAFLNYLYDERTGSYSYVSNDFLPLSIKEELPAVIRNEKHLREVIDFIAGELEEYGEYSIQDI